MADSAGRRSVARHKSPSLRRAWCCSFAGAPQSPDLRASNHHIQQLQRHQSKPPVAKASYTGSFHSSPSPSSKLGLCIIDPRRILSPGRVSPIDSDVAPIDPLPELMDSPAVSISAAIATVAESEAEPASSDPIPETRNLPSERPEAESRASFRSRGLDLTLCLKGRDGRCLVLELDSRILCKSSAFFAAMIRDCEEQASDAAEFRKIEVAGVRDMDVFKETIELMFEKDVMRWFMKAGVFRAVDILEVSSTIMFERGIRSCLNYIEAVPWSESEEEKIRSFFLRCTLDEAVAQDVLARLAPLGWNSSDDLALQLIQSVTNGTNNSARKEMQSLVNGLLSKSSVYQKDPVGLNKQSLYQNCHSCLNSLVEHFEEASGSLYQDLSASTRKTKPLIERVSKQVENLNWIFDILIDKEMAEDFVDLWANQNELRTMHAQASPMVRYELSRISASVFIALGRRKLHCRGGKRVSVLQAWFSPMLMDFGWLQRCSKGLDARMLEESLGQVLLTLPLNLQQSLFEDWFRCFAGHGTECPNLSKAFQVWWRRSFGSRSSEAQR